ncbi:MAG TPA: HRDC domain-containing protein [Candidatus Udaeobacter sp.]|nr:HRDC domain-containing protein [Candidatus Udaeobacter sp.]
MITDPAQLASVVKQIESADRIAVDTEADSLHSYREKLCLLQISVPVVSGTVDAGDDQADLGKVEDHRSRLQPSDFIVDPLANLDLELLRRTLEGKEIVLHGADYDLRMLRRGLNLAPSRIFDTMIAARLLGIREFSLAAVVKRYFGRTLLKGSQKANWAQRPLPARMAEYAINDVHYLLPLAEKLEAELDRCKRRDWLRQSCQRAVELAAVARTRNQDELWRIRGSGILRGRAAAVLRALWQWREKEAEKADRPPFHILQNEELLKAAAKIASGSVPEYRHFSFRRREAFREAAQAALREPESEWPVSRRRSGTRPTTETIQRAEELRRRRDKSAEELGLEPSFISPRSTVEAIAADGARTPALLVPWQRALLGISVSGSEESTNA